MSADVTEIRRSIVEAATKLSERRGYTNITREDVTTELGYKSRAVINSHFAGMDGLRKLVMKRAIQDENLRIIAQGIAAGDPLTKRLPEKLRVQALLSIA